MRKREPFRHITDRDRDRIQALRDNWYSQKDVAEILGIPKSAVSRELQRNPTRTGRYVADRASTDAAEQRSHSKYPGMKIEAHPELKRYIIRALKKLRSPDEIAGHLRRVNAVPRVGKNAIYKWLYRGAGQPYCRYLVVPEAKLLAGAMLPNRESVTVMTSARTHFHRIRVDTCTADNGIENVGHATTGIPTYCCDRGAPRQKPHVAGAIGLIRRWFIPKGTDLALVSDRLFQSQLHLLNGRYRRSLGYRNAYEAALERGIISKVPRLSLTPAVAFR